MKLGKYASEQDTSEMTDEHLELKYEALIEHQVVANAVTAVLLKLEIERRRTEVLQSAAKSAAEQKKKE